MASTATPVPPTAEWPAQSDRAFARRLLLTIGVIGAVLLGLIGIWAARSALLLIYVSALVAIGLWPFVRRVERVAAMSQRVRVPRWVAVAVVYIVFVAGVGLVAGLVVPQVLSQAGHLRSSMPALIARSQAGLVRNRLISQSITVEEVAREAPNSDGTSPVPTEAAAVVGVAGGMFSALTVLVLTFYFLMDGPRLFAYLTSFLPSGLRPSVGAIGREVTARVSAWLHGNLIIGVIMGGATAILLGMLGVPYLYIAALVAALGEMAPVAGPLLAGAFAVALSLTVSVQLALVVGLAFFALHQLEANVLVPRIMARKIGLSSLAIIIALLVGFEWSGLAGMVLAIPTLAIATAAIEELRA